MIWNSIAEQWGQLTSQLTATWGKLSAEDLADINGKKRLLIAKLQQRYAISVDDATAQVYKWVATVAVGQLGPPLPNAKRTSDRETPVE